jgi:short-subunit dehydrogenase
MGVYSTSKAAVNHLTLKLQQENPDLTIFPIWYVLSPRCTTIRLLLTIYYSPGPVQTDMGYEAATALGVNMDEFGLPVDESVKRVLAQIEKTEYQEDRKVLWSAMGKEVPF